MSITSVALAVAPGLGFQLPVNRSNPSCWMSPEHDVDGIAEAAEVEVEVAKAEADEFGAKILRRSPKKRMSLRSPSMTDKRKMLGMSLATTDLFNHGPMESFSAHGTALVAGAGMSTPMRGSASVRKTRRVSDLAGYSEDLNEGININEDIEGAPSKQKRARLI